MDIPMSANLEDKYRESRKIDYEKEREILVSELLSKDKKMDVVSVLTDHVRRKMSEDSLSSRIMQPMTPELQQRRLNAY